VADAGAKDSHGDGILQSREDEFLGLYAMHAPSLRGYLLCQVPRWIDAEEIFQRCAVLLWEKFDQFEPGTNFEAWACHIVRLEVMNFGRSFLKAN
jgi:RNA polymerase sigma-70 factor (ECF subfamily)